jgi:N-acetylglucosaminyldiphosphoundecaprenol N-acetyl-beta-D-mannosaminyltransferase
MSSLVEIVETAQVTTSAPRVRVAGCPVDRLSFSQALEEIFSRIEHRIPSHVVFVNAAKVVSYQRDRRLREAVDSADFLLADGVPVVWASRLLGQSIPGRVNGTDLMEHMIKVSAERGYRVFFLGAREDVLETAIHKLKQRYPDLVVAGSHHGYFRAEDENSLIRQIVASQTQLLFLAISTPRKETWANENLHRLGAIVCQGVGGSIDVVAGMTRRAPVWMQRTGLEWFFRLLQEPRRMWRRYLDTNTVFMWMVLRDFLYSRFEAKS